MDKAHYESQSVSFSSCHAIETRYTSELEHTLKNLRDSYWFIPLL